MNIKWEIIIIIILMIGIGIFVIYTNFDIYTITSPSPDGREKCIPIIFNGNEKINIVIFSDGEIAKKYSDYFLNNEPFMSNHDKFNFFYIDYYTPQCELYEDIALLCYSRELIKKVGSCPNDFIIVIKDMPSNIRSSSYMNVLSINKNLPLTVLLHEFGHAFANLADEYVPSKIPFNSKNCQSDCKKFPVKDGCYEGCSREDYFRSVENGVMRTLSTNNYGTLNKKIITDRLNLVKTGITLRAVQEFGCEDYYELIEGKYIEDSHIDVLSKSIEYGCIGSNGAGPFNYKVIMKDNSEIIGGEFNPELIFTDTINNGVTEGEAISSEIPFLLKVPLIKDSKTLEIAKDSKILARINLIDTNSRPCKKI